MAFSLDSLTRPETRAIHATLVGEAGVGKTSVAASFPAPVFIRTEDGMASLQGHDVQAFPICRKFSDVCEQIAVLCREDHPFKTLVIDSVTQLNTMIEKEIVESDPKAKSIAQACGGYGAGYSAASEKHRQIREACDWLNQKKGMHVVYIAHADVETIDQPDLDPYSRYTLRLHRKSISHYTDNVDLVGYLKLKTFTVGESGARKKAETTGERILTCYPTPNHVSKNRFGIKDDLTVPEGKNPFTKFIPALSQEMRTPEPTAEATEGEKDNAA